MVVLPIPPMPQIPIVRTSDGTIDSNLLICSMRESAPTRPLNLLGDARFNLFQIVCTTSVTSLDSGLQKMKEPSLTQIVSLRKKCK